MVCHNAFLNHILMRETSGNCVDATGTVTAGNQCRWSLLSIFGFLWWSSFSPSRQQRNIVTAIWHRYRYGGQPMFFRLNPRGGKLPGKQVTPSYFLQLFFAILSKLVNPLPVFWQAVHPKLNQMIRWFSPMTSRIVLGAISMQKLSWFASWKWRWTRATSSEPLTHISRTRDSYVLLGIFWEVEIQVMFD